MPITIQGPWFKDEQGRTLMLRGVNLGGSSKLPYTPDGATHLPKGFFDHRSVSFVGRPFPLAEADEHLARMRRWGIRILRLLAPWEAIEHSGPGQYDEAYLDYLYKVVERVAAHDMMLFIDPHQDVWSRLSGGDGAPGWTLEAVGFEPRHFAQTGAAIVHQTYGDPFPRMIWPTNYTKLATATMFTLFFAGDDFAPNSRIEGQSVQTYLQGHYFNAMKQVAERLKGFDHVLGYDSLNEPSSGYIGWQNLATNEATLKLGDMPTPYQSMLLGEGLAQSVTHWILTPLGTFQRRATVISPGGQRAWQEGRPCIWRENGVWDFDSKGLPHLLQPDYFSSVNGRQVNFAQDYLRPFANQYAASIREADPDAILFFETEAVGHQVVPQWGPQDAQNMVFVPHWYDGLTLFTKRFWGFLGVDLGTSGSSFPIVFGKGAVQRSFIDQVGRLKALSAERLGNVPSLIGEIGIPYDMNNGSGFRHGDFSVHEAAIDASMRALEENLLSFTWWNYTADNSNARGDSWNGEDLSIYSADQRKDPQNPDSGGRGLGAFVRPYAYATAGRPLRMQFNRHSGEFSYSFRHDAGITAATEFYIPALQYPQGCEIQVSDGHYELDAEAQILRYWHSDKDVPHWVQVRPAQPRPEEPGNPWRWLLLALSAVAFLRWLRRR